MEAPKSQTTQIQAEAASNRIACAAVKVQIIHGAEHSTDVVPTTVLEPGHGWLVDFPELWRYRELLYFLAWRDVKVRYKQTFLGAAWAVLQPAMLMVLFTVSLSWMAGLGDGECPYPLYAYLGLLPWTFFAGAVGNAGASVAGNERLITKVYFPRLAIPFAAVAAAGVDFFIAFGLQLALLGYYGVAPGLPMLLLPVIWLLLLATALGAGTLMAALTVQFRDFRYALPFLMQCWMFATPAIYLEPRMPSSGWLTFLLSSNPLTGLIHAHRAASLGQALPWGELGMSVLVAGILVAAGCLYFRRVEESFADII
jgi:lipopolysaccharide transport system permease protein